GVLSLSQDWENNGASGCAVPAETRSGFSPGAGAQRGQDFKLHQPQDKVSVKAGETLTLNCTVSGSFAPGPVKWLKGWGTENRTIYEDTTGPASLRVTRAVEGSNTDFTIHIRDAQPEDVGTYYCVKFQKSLSGGNEVFRHGSGTEVSVLAKPSTPIVSGPSQRTRPGQSVAFTCTAGGFFPENIGVKWFKDKASVSSQLPQVTEWREKSYNMSSNVTVVLEERDVLSRLICKSSPTARLHEPEKSSEATTQAAVGLIPAWSCGLASGWWVQGDPGLSSQRRNSLCLAQESDPNNLTYADLNFDKERKTIRRMVEMSQQSEYACIQTSQAPNGGDDNLTYADLDMVHLSKAPKRPAPRPEEASSEYASVQIPRK
ncbi:tyrosine-protein phosphatase non-receptor type substrate 1-like, partial [Empidonax traillii]|uniref:tyrosine-protein phosphatase non-receptor type substrate 1-like n=1 Tax=Empidonax traillii TaxID=164674 RepID=UPI000FFD0060